MAAASPFEGINALEAVQLMFAGIVHCASSCTRIIACMASSSMAAGLPISSPSMPPARSQRAAPREPICRWLTQKIINIAKGAALMTGAELSYHFFENHFDNYVPVPALVQLTKGLGEFGF